jgi:hypothetical protein
VVSSSSPHLGDRRSRLAAERGDQPAARRDGEVLDSRRSRREETPSTGAIALLSTSALKIITGKKKRARKAEVASAAARTRSQPKSEVASAAARARLQQKSRLTSFPEQADVVTQLVPGPATSPHGIDLHTGPMTTQLPRVARPADPASRTTKRSTPRTDALRLEHLRTGSIPVAEAQPELDLSDDDAAGGRGRRADRPDSSRRRAELAIGRVVSQRRVWGIGIAMLLVLIVPGASILTKSVVVADSGLNSNGNGDVQGIREFPDDNRSQGPITIAEPTAAQKAAAKAKATAASTAKAKAKRKSSTGGSGGTAPSAGSASRITDGASGLGWASGAYIPGSSPGKIKAFGDWRGAGMDVAVDWESRASWNDIVNPDWLYNAWRGTPYTKVFGVAPVPEGDSSATMAGCANGDYNDKWTQFGQNIKNAGLDDETVIRLGWEFNGDWYKWSAGNPGQFVDCWQQIVGTVRKVAPKLLWDWNPNRGAGQALTDARKAYPGDSYVDIVGVDSYDMFPGATNEAGWQEQYSGAYGLKFWVDFARQHGKKFSVPEWAVYPGTASNGNNGGDNAFYVGKMHSFFKSLGSELAFEAYFNESASYVQASIYGPTENSNAAARYQSLFH